MTIKNRNLTVGMTLVGKYHKQEHKCQVVQGEGDKLRYRLEDNREFKSPSAAGMAITGHACDGWVFWSVETNPPADAQTSETLKEETDNAADSAQATAQQTAAAPEPKEEPATTAVTEQAPASKNFRRTPNQKGVTDGMTRWYCQTCEESFLAPYGEIPQECPQGHKA
jgi:hypothetical protein